jgi:hypothetical protein
MPRGSSFTLTGGATLGLFFIQRYRFLTIDQFARAAELNRSTASNQLRMMERHGLLGYFGNTGLAGGGVLVGKDQGTCGEIPPQVLRDQPAEPDRL